MVPHVEKASGESEGGPDGPVLDDPENADTEADQDDSDVLDAVVREQPLQVVLGERKNDAEHAGDDPERQQREPQPFRKGRQQGKSPNESVDSHLQDHARQQRRDVAGRRRVRPGEPDVERHDPGLDAEPEKGENQNGRQKRRSAESGRPHEEPGSRRLAEKPEHREQEESRDVRRDDVDPSRAKRLGVVLLGRDEKEGRETDQFPADEERPGVSGDHHHEQPGGRDAVEAAELARVVRVLGFRPVAFAINRSEGRHQKHRHEKERAQPVDREADRSARQPPGVLRGDRILSEEGRKPLPRRPPRSPRRAGWSRRAVREAILSERAGRRSRCTRSRRRRRRGR